MMSRTDCLLTAYLVAVLVTEACIHPYARPERESITFMLSHINSRFTSIYLPPTTCPYMYMYMCLPTRQISQSTTIRFRVFSNSFSSA